MCENCTPLPSYLGYISFFFGALYLLFAWTAAYVGIKLARQLQHEKETALQATAMAHQAQLRMLRYQLNPHFLFNTLNAISTLVLDGRREQANGMVGALSGFLRYSLDSDPEQRVTLDQEIESVRRYLGIEQVRFGDRLRVGILVTPEAAGALVPSLILQPLIENAIKFAVSRREEGGRIELVAHADDGVLEITVRDDGPGSVDYVPKSGGGHGVGLANTRERLLRPLRRAAELYDPHMRTARNSGNATPAARTSGRGHRPMRMRTLIVDDEPLARRGLALRLARHHDIDIVAEAGNGREAFFAISEHQPALMFLDVQMPGVDGFELLRAVPAAQLPLTIFVTAYDQYALKAFEANALDYLLKPIEDARLDTAIDRARQELATRDADEHCERLLRLLGTLSGQTGPDARPGAGRRRPQRRATGRRSPRDQGRRPHPARAARRHPLDRRRRRLHVRAHARRHARAARDDARARGKTRSAAVPAHPSIDDRQRRARARAALASQRRVFSDTRFGAAAEVVAQLQGQGAVAALMAARVISRYRVGLGPPS